MRRRRTIDGQIIAVADNAAQIGQFQVVVLNRGTTHGLAPGAVLAIDQQGAVVARQVRQVAVGEEGRSARRCSCPMSVPAR